MQSYNFDDANLPKVNPNEDLETISNNHFRPLFTVDKFEIRSEQVRDKGIDFHIELKKELPSGESVYTNFRFAVQLKATDTVLSNSDGSFSLQIDTANINYLLNNGMPALYVFYHQPTNSFYYENVNYFANSLLQKDPDWNQKAKHTLRFSKLLDTDAIHDIYETTYGNGVLLRQLNRHLKFSSIDDQSQGILIDADREIYSPAENIEFIDQFGADLINKNQFKYIVEIEKRTHPRINATPRFNLFCGIAYFQCGNLFKGMELLKLAQQEIEILDSNMQAMLMHTILNGKYLLGMITKTNFDEEMQKVKEIEGSGAFFQVEKAFDELSSNKVETTEGMKRFYSTIQDVLKDEKSPQIKLIAYGKIISAESAILFHDLTSNFAYFLGRVPQPLQSPTYLQWLDLEEEYLKRLDELIQYALKYEYFIGIANLSVARIKWEYERTFHAHYLGNWLTRSFDLEKPVDEQMVIELSSECERLDIIAENYEMFQFHENGIACLILKYQIQHFLRDMEAANITKLKVMKIINDRDFVGLKEECDPTFNGDTGHERFVEKYTTHINLLQDSAKKFGIDINSITPEMFVGKKPKWTMEKFFEFDFTEG